MILSAVFFFFQPVLEVVLICIVEEKSNVNLMAPVRKNSHPCRFQSHGLMFYLILSSKELIDELAGLYVVTACYYCDVKKNAKGIMILRSI